MFSYSQTFLYFMILLHFVPSIFMDTNRNEPSVANNGLNRNFNSVQNMPVYNTTQNSSRRILELDSNIENKFHINANMIIRTGESRVLGAKYLNETTLSTSHDCLVWCLETSNCNAAVYEQRSLKSCYLFDCGTPPKFLCKFAPHDFFLSSVLKVTRHSYELREWGNQMKHEKELTNIKTEETHITMSSSLVSEPEMTNTPLIITPVPTNTTKVASKCRHNQFQCVNNSECIAIYNVCDGIPQCPDGSDESVDLKCHMKDINDNALQEVKTAEVTPTEEVKKVVTGVENNPLQTGSRYSEKAKTIWPERVPSTHDERTDYYHRSQDSDGLGSPFLHKHSQFVAANDPQVQNLNRWSNDYDSLLPHSIPLEPVYDTRIEDQYLPNPISPDYDGIKGYGSYRQEDSPYWSNQDAGLPDGTSYSADEFPQAPMRPHSKPNSYINKEKLYAQQLARTASQFQESPHRVAHRPPMDIPTPVEQHRPPSDIEVYKAHIYPLPDQPYISYEDAIQKQLSRYADMKSKQYEPPHRMDQSAYSNDDLIRASLVNQLPPEHERPTHGMYKFQKHLEVNASPVYVKPKINEEDIKKPSLKDDSLVVLKPIPKQSGQTTLLDLKMSVTELYEASRTRRQEANSAILALMIGIVFTFLLAILIGCRIKTIQKRLSRKGRGLAHDADYLVNGMYL